MGNIFSSNKIDDPFYSLPPKPNPIISTYPISQTPINYGESLSRYGRNPAYSNRNSQAAEALLTLTTYQPNRVQRLPNNFAGRYVQGYNQVPGIAPWNYANYYLGNTTMQMIPFMMRKIQRFQSQQVMAEPSASVSYNPSPPIMPMIYPSASTTLSMMAAATPLPATFSPLIQGVYPSVTMNSANWMSPSSFMYALNSGPMPYRPPDSAFPSSISMVMPIPYGVPNPFLSSSISQQSYASKNDQDMNSQQYYNSMGSMPNTSFSSPNYYQQVSNLPMSSSMTSRLSPMVSSSFPVEQYSVPLGVNGPMLSNQNQFNQHVNYTDNVFDSSQSSSQSNNFMPIYETISAKSHPRYSSQSKTSDAQSASISKMRNLDYEIMESLRHDPFVPPIRNGELIYDSGWVSRKSELKNKFSSFFSSRKKKAIYSTSHGRMVISKNQSRVSFLPKNGLIRRNRKTSHSPTSEYDCAICQEQRDRKRVKEHYGDSLLSAKISEVKELIEPTISTAKISTTDDEETEVRSKTKSRDRLDELMKPTRTNIPDPPSSITHTIKSSVTDIAEAEVTDATDNDAAMNETDDEELQETFQNIESNSENTDEEQSTSSL